MVKCSMIFCSWNMPRPILLSVSWYEKTDNDRRQELWTPINRMSEIIEAGISFKARVNLYAFMSRDS